MARTIVTLTLASAFACALASLATAQTPNPTRTQCVNDGNAVSLETQIAACTSLIDNPATDDYQRATFYFLRGTARYDQRNYAAAIADYDQAILRRPDIPPYYDARCWTRAESRGDLQLAYADCSEALRIEPRSISAYDTRGYVQLLMQRYDGAWNDYNTAVRLDPADPHPLYGRGIAALRLGRSAEGQADITRALQMDPDIERTYATYGINR